MTTLPFRRKITIRARPGIDGAMPFHFKKKESVAEGAQRICCERLDDALAVLEGPQKFAAVHHVRKEIKKLRALLRLVRPGIGKPAYRDHTIVLRGVARRLTALRDAEVKVSALDDAIKHFNGRLPEESLPGVRNALREICRAEEEKLFKGRSLLLIKKVLSEEKEQLTRMELKSKGAKVIRSGLKKIYGRGRKALATASREPSPENFHAWRKRVKDLAHQLRLFCAARPRKIKARAEALDQLGELLGTDHDLFLLREFVADKFQRAEDAGRFQELIAGRQAELRSQALELGDVCYSRKPGRYCRKMGKDWKSWKRR